VCAGGSCVTVCVLCVVCVEREEECMCVSVCRLGHFCVREKGWRAFCGMVGVCVMVFSRGEVCHCVYVFECIVSWV
jgi:hypothetical protein